MYTTRRFKNRHPVLHCFCIMHVPQSYCKYDIKFALATNLSKHFNKFLEIQLLEFFAINMQ